MTSPTLEISGAVVPRLKADAAVAAIVGDRIYDHVPRDASGTVSTAYPFVGLGDTAETRDDVDCIRGVEVFYRVECWSRRPGKVEVLQLADAVVASLGDANLTLTDNALVSFEHIRTDVIREDGLTSHAILEFRALVEQP